MLGGTVWADAPRASGRLAPAGPRPSRGHALAHRQLPVRPHEVAGVPARIALQVVLVLGLRFPERARGSELGGDLARPQSGRIHVVDGVLRRLTLRFARVVDPRAIARAAVVALPV